MERKHNPAGSTLFGQDNGAALTAPLTPQRRGAIRTRLYREGTLIEEDFPADQISEELRERHGCLIWLDLCEPTTRAARHHWS